MRKHLYKAWLFGGLATIILSILLTVAFHLTTPKGCVACDMGAVGLVPLWLLSLLVLLVNCVVIPAYAIRHKAEKNGILIFSLVYLAISFIALTYVGTMIVINL